MKLRIIGNAGDVGAVQVLDEHGDKIKGVRGLTVHADATGMLPTVELSLHPRSVDLDVLCEWHMEAGQARHIVAAVMKAKLDDALKTARESLHPQMSSGATIDALEAVLRHSGLLP